MTSQFQVKPFRLAHLDIFDVAPAHKKDIVNLERQFRQFFSQPHLNNFLGTHIMDGKIIFIAGYFQIAPGVLEVFVYSSIYMSKYPIAIVKQLRWWLGHLAYEHRTRRIQTWGNEQIDTGKWLRLFGFVEEAELRYYLPDNKKVKIYAIYYPENF